MSIRNVALAIAATSLAVVVAFVGFTRLSARDAKTIGTPENPAVFLLSASHARNAKPASLQAIARMMSDKSGMTVTVDVAKDSVGAVEAFGAERVDIALLNLTEYFLARQEFNVDAKLQVLRDSDPRDAYFAVLVVSAESATQKVEELQGKHVAFVDEFSVSGFAYPAVMLREANVVPEFAGSHERALALVKEGGVAAAATYEQIAQRDPSLKVIARSNAIPNEPIVTRRGLSDEVTRKLVDAVSALSQSADGLAALTDVAAISGFAPATEASFDGALGTLREAGRTAETLVPGGRSLVLRNSPILNGVQ